jgi:diamine N-acetyltransferase
MLTSQSPDNKVFLRAIEAEDLDYLMEWENDTSLWIYSDTTAPLSKRIIAHYISNYDADVFRSGQLRLMIEEKNTGLTMGIIDLYKVDAVNSNAMVGIFIEPRQQRKGYAFDALQILMEYSHDTLGLHQLLAMINADNLPSLHLFRKAGFSDVGFIPDWRRNPMGFVGVNILNKIL